MKRIREWGLLLALLVAAPAAAQEGGIDVELRTDRGGDAVYREGEAMEVTVRSSEDGYVLVYEIDAEGSVRLLWPDHGSRGYLEAGRVLALPEERSSYELVVEGPTGQGYLVAIVSLDPFRELPWYLRPAGGEYERFLGRADEEEGITSEGRVVGDPFVAMERIRRRVLRDPEDVDAFGTAYASYYAHERVRYPRYLCYDCHRPGYWAWWDGFDPYYASCSVFHVRVNYGWYWGPGYWFGSVPYYYFVYRSDSPVRYRMFSSRYRYHSSWDGWRRWTGLWGGSLRRFKSAPPADYVSPARYKDRSSSGARPPGFLPERRGSRDGTGRPAQERVRRTKDLVPDRAPAIGRRADQDRGWRNREVRPDRPPAIGRRTDQDRGWRNREVRPDRPPAIGRRMDQDRGWRNREVRPDRPPAIGRRADQDRPTRERETLRDPGRPPRGERRDLERRNEERARPLREIRSRRESETRGSLRGIPDRDERRWRESARRQEEFRGRREPARPRQEFRPQRRVERSEPRREHRVEERRRTPRQDRSREEPRYEARSRGQSDSHPRGREEKRSREERGKGGRRR